ncbi:aerobic-type carbon monoxide dehydrogenase, large subunit CoxL/CutL-like protein [Acidovorax sp. CF316]|nr:aerobic-type carbon monoxide dehydrogenase, large subunit CoxL/CutL-like protein [Acidovorax sp. CF316]
MRLSGEGGIGLIRSMLKTAFTPLRREDPALLTGRGQYTGDVVAEGVLHAVFVRSPLAHGRLRSIATGAAEQSAGVVAVLIAETLLAPSDADRVVHMPPPNPLLPVASVPRIEPLARGEVVYVGQPVALVLARSPAQAQQAASCVQLDIEPLVPVPDFDGTRPVTEVEHHFEAADASTHVVASEASAALEVPRVLALSMEPRGMLAHWHGPVGADAAPARLTVHLGTQSPTRAQADIAAALGWDEARVRVITGNVGGAFGAKSSLCPEELAIPLAARRVGASVRWISSRSDEFTSGMHGRGARMSGRLSVTAQGRFAALQAELQFTLGAWLPFSAVVPLRNTARILPGPYRVARLDVQGRAGLAHTAPVTIYRGAGRPEAALLMETLVEQAARAAGIDPVELRRRNLVEAADMPYTTPTGEVFDSGDYRRALELACERFGYAEQRALQAQRRAEGEVVGIGMALYVEPCGVGWESARVDWHEDGRVTVATGSPAQGQGHGTTYARIAGEALGMADELVEVVYGDTALCPPGVGALASRSTALAGSAIVQACRDLLARRAAGEALPLTSAGRFTGGEAWSYGCVIARMAVDRDTGRPTIEQITWADDAGHIVHPELAKGQLIGGLAQGLGQALLERLVYDGAGQLVTGSLMDYAAPRADDMPAAIDIHSFSTPSPHNLLGAKGVGEAGCIGVPAALMNAARDALAPVGECPLQFPLTSEQFWRAMSGQGL